MRAFAVLSLLLALLATSHGHMWLRTPLARGGLNDIGGTTSDTAPACLRAANVGTTTTYEAGDKVTFQFRVNQHGPGKFSFTLYSSTNTVIAVLASNLPNNVTAGPDSFNGVNTPVTLPASTCDGCYVMLLGMADANGKSPWVNCANVKIVPVGSLGVPKVTSVTPATGPTTGGTLITVTGSNFGTSNPNCYFDKVSVKGTRVSNTTVTCTSPPRNQPSGVAVELSFNGGNTVSASGTAFTYTGSVILPTISSISPKSAGPNTLITITGSNFYSAEMKCKFSIPNGANVYTDATATSQTTATCLSPPTINGQINFKIEVSVDGSDYSQSGLVFAGSSTGSSSATTLLPSLSWLGGLALLLVALF